MQGIFFNDWQGGHIPDILDEIYTKKVYDAYFEGKSNLTIVDCGANIGLTTRYFSQFGKVYSLEPCASAFECLKKTIEFNGLNAVPLKYAVSTHSGEAEFYHNPNSTANSLNSLMNVLGEKEIVATKTLAEVFEDLNINHVDFMKLDVEGEEFNILGHDSFDLVASKIDVIMGEIHDQTFGRNPGQVYQALQNRGFKVKKIPADANIFYAEK